MTEIKRMKMVEWYDPRQLLNTAGKTVLSEIVGEYADPRLGTADATLGKFFDYSTEIRRTKYDFEPIAGDARKDIWIDYAADVGDGWNSTYAVAFNLARKSLTVRGEPLARGEILIFGGDGVYPTAASNEYKDRLIAPYEMAFKASRTARSDIRADAVNLKEEPHVFALPGNHDWYDSLVAFRKIFCSHIFNDRRFAEGWRTRQKRSYFTLKLPHGWWLLAVDLQLSHNIDVSQLVYFESIIEQMQPGDRVILCVPEPYWVKAIKYQDLTDVFKEKEDSVYKLERFFERKGVRIEAYIAGDLHHYRRFVDAADGTTHKITAGGGGAFLHPTHDYDYRKHESKNKGYRLVTDYPTVAESKRLDWKNLYFFWNNPTFGIFTAVVYALLAWLLYAKISYKFEWESLVITLNHLIAQPSAIFVVALLLGGLIFFTDSHSTWYKVVAGFLHGVAHLTAVILLGWLVYFLNPILVNKLGIETEAFQTLFFFGSVLVVALIGGYFIGALIMGVYLFYSLHIRGRHDNEAFSALKIEDYKNFLRLHITEDALTIYPFKVERVPRAAEWKLKKENGVEFYASEKSFEAELIEDPIRIETKQKEKK